MASIDKINSNLSNAMILPLKQLMLQLFVLEICYSPISEEEIYHYYVKDFG